MKESLITKLEGIAERREEIDALLSSPEVINDQDRYRAYSQERAEIDPVVGSFENYRSLRENLSQAEELLAESDADMRELAA